MSFSVEMIIPKEEVDDLGQSASMIAVIPVRMTEAWLLFDEDSIKIAAGNPNNSRSLSLPSLQQAEKLPDPKAILYQKIKEAIALQGRKLAKLKIPQRVHVLVENIKDFSSLRYFTAFKKLEADIKEALTNHPSS
jgi:hypothetical protein